MCLKAVKLIWSTLLKKHVLFCFGFLSLSLFYFSETCFFSESQTPHDEEMLVSMFSAMQQKLAYRVKEKRSRRKQSCEQNVQMKSCRFKAKQSCPGTQMWEYFTKPLLDLNLVSKGFSTQIGDQIKMLKIQVDPSLFIFIYYVYILSLLMIQTWHSVINICIITFVMLMRVFLRIHDFHTFTYSFTEHLGDSNVHIFTNGIYMLKFSYLHSSLTIHSSP